MRILFTIVGLLGLIMASFAIFEICTATDYQSKIKGVQFILSEEGRQEVTEAHRRHEVITGQVSGYSLSSQLDGFDTLRDGWFIVAVCSVTLLFVGAAGTLVERKLRAQDAAPWFSRIKRSYSLPLIVVAAILALASWPLLFVALVWQFLGEDSPPALILFLSWVASGLFWGFFVESLYKMIRHRRSDELERF